MAYSTLVLRHTHKFATGAATLRCENAAGSSRSDQAFSTVTEYVSSGDSTLTPYKDFKADLQTKLNNAYSTLFGGGPITVTLQTTGKWLYSNAGGSAMVLAFTDPITTAPPEIFGFDGTADKTIPAGGTLESDWLSYGGWYPGDIHVDDTLDIPRWDVATLRGLQRIPDYVQHSDSASTPHTRRILWDRIDAARIAQCYADLSGYAAVAGLSAGDQNAPLTSHIAWVLAGSGPSPGEYLIYSTNDPSTHTVAGPYYLDIPDELMSNLVQQQLTERQRKYRLQLDFTLVV